MKIHDIRDSREYIHVKIYLAKVKGGSRVIEGGVRALSSSTILRISSINDDVITTPKLKKILTEILLQRPTGITCMMYVTLEQYLPPWRMGSITQPLDNIYKHVESKGYSNELIGE